MKSHQRTNGSVWELDLHLSFISPVLLLSNIFFLLALTSCTLLIHFLSVENSQSDIFPLFFLLSHFFNITISQKILYDYMPCVYRRKFLFLTKVGMAFIHAKNFRANISYLSTFTYQNIKRHGCNKFYERVVQLDCIKYCMPTPHCFTHIRVDHQINLD